MRYLLDTNICIYLIKNQPPHVLSRLALQTQDSVVMSVVTYAELRAGLEMQSTDRAHDEQVLALLTQRIPVLPFTEADARNYGVLRAAVRDRARHAMDRLIAAQAITTGLILVTNNTADFKDYPGLELENWALPQ
jgi:tRNA(fMet)-specific endonuclease VapC